VLAVGGGEAILNKIRLLQRTSATIELVADTLDDTLDGLVSHGAVAWVGRASSRPISTASWRYSPPRTI
jgi:siroheme synthase (precorrin-2 oxidase/ferrochelatase)